MKKVMICLCLLSMSNAILAQTKSAQEVATTIATRMKDSLGLSDSQRALVYSANLSINQQKAAVWQQFSDDVILKQKLQQVENSRDSLYSAILTPGQQNLYLQKKKGLVTSN